MAITIELYERTGTAGSFIDEKVTNMNWKRRSLVDSLHKYYYYPVRIPFGDELTSHSVPKYIFAKITGSYSKAMRVRWKISGQADDGTRVLVGQTNTFATPTTLMRGDLTTLPVNGTPMYYIPRLSTTSPTTGMHLSTLQANTTYYTDFLVTQFFMDDSASTVGNSNEYTVELILDEYE